MPRNPQIEDEKDARFWQGGRGRGGVARGFFGLVSVVGFDTHPMAAERLSLGFFICDPPSFVSPLSPRARTVLGGNQTKGSFIGSGVIKPQRNLRLSRITSPEIEPFHSSCRLLDKLSGCEYLLR